MKRFNITKNILLFWCLFIGVGAVFGGLCMLIEPSGKIMGMKDLLPFFQVLPFADTLFSNFIFPGIALLIVNGITNIVASVLIIKKNKYGLILGAIFGFTLMLWITIQFVIFPPNFMSTIYFIFGILQLLSGILSIIFYKQYGFAFSCDYVPNEASDTLVVFFSREGYVKKIAFETAKTLNANVLEITTKERTTKDFLGFMWCGRFAMHKWAMDIDQTDENLEKYKKVIICSPVWAFTICAPIRRFLQTYHNKIKNVEYKLVHFSNFRYNYLFDEMDEILGLTRTKATSIVCRFGTVKKEKDITLIKQKLEN